MTIEEKRQYVRTEDQVYFDYRLMTHEEYCYDQSITEDLLGQHSQQVLEATQFFQGIDYELAKTAKALAEREPVLAHYLNLMNAKMDYLVRHLLIGNKVQMHRVNISLGGMSFKTKERLKGQAPIKIILYTRPKMLPVLLDAVVVYSQFQHVNQYRTAVEFLHLTVEQERMLTEHIMLAQISKSHIDS